VTVHCAALSPQLLESELFGHERGAFTGAVGEHRGAFERAHNGTLFLDEVGELAIDLQPKLLRALEQRAVRRVGGTSDFGVDVRIIAATNRDLPGRVKSGTFREDLYYRLQVIEIHVPPLRERRDEIPALIEFFLRRYAARYGRPAVRMSDGLREALVMAPWPGNVRELENVMKRFVILQEEALVRAELERSQHEWSALPLPARAAAPVGFATVSPAPAAPAAPAAPYAPMAVPPAPASAAALENGAPAAAPTIVEARPSSTKLPDLARAAALSAEREAIARALDQFHWNRRKAARLLGVSYKTLLNKMKACGITEPPGVGLE
jgi:transcriptional regulator with GAF, ATPase, and Fis domain